MSTLATVARKSFNGKFTAKIDFAIGHFMFLLLMLTLEVLLSLHTLFDEYLDHMLVKLEQNRMIQTITIFVVLFDKNGLQFFEEVSLSVFQKLRQSDTGNQVKSCTKHGRPDQSERKLTVALRPVKWVTL